jgi:hypothetical protein
MASLLDLINAKKQQIDAGKRSNAKRIPDGRSRLRILPSWRTDGNQLDNQFWHDYGQHFIKQVGVNGIETVAATYICVDRTHGRACEVCKAIAEAAGSVNDDALSKLITSAKASARTLVNALHIDGSTPTVPEVFEFPPTVFEQFIGLMQLYLLEGVNILSLQDGFDISIERTGKGLSTKYTVAAAPKSTAINADVLTKITDLDKYVAQENDTNKVRAITEIRNVAGLLGSTPALGSPQHLSLPASTASLLDVEEDLTQQIPNSAPVNTAPVVQDAEFTETQKAAASVAAVVAVATAATTPVATTGDAELDNLLADLNLPS